MLFHRYSLCAAVLAVVCAAPSPAAVLRVSQNAPTDSQDGASWATAFRSVADALARSAAGDEVWVGPGVYTGTVSVGRDRAVYGGFIGTETRRDQRRGLPDISVLQAAPSAPAVVFSSDTTPATVLDGFLIRGATSVAAVVCAGGSPTISRNIFRGNADDAYRATNPIDPDGAAAIFESGGDAVIESNLIVANTGNAINGAGRIRHNTIVANMGAGFRAAGAGAVELTGNIIAGNLKGVVLFPASGVARGNCVWGNDRADFDRCDAFTGTNGNISADPRFVSPMSANYALSNGSPCADALAGIGDGPDLHLRPRPLGSGTDMGAMESDGRTWYAPPRIIRVAPDGSDANDGSSWASPMSTLKAALAAASDGVEIWLANGAYAEQDALELPAFVSVYGGFAGTELTRDARKVVGEGTILTNAAGAPILTATGGYRVSVLDGIAFRGADNTDSGVAAGVDCRRASPILRGCRFTGLKSGGADLVIKGFAAAPLITDCVFDDNTVDSAAPGMLYFSGGSAPRLERNTFTSNRVTGSGGAGIIGIEHSPCLVLRNNVFARNTPGDAGWMTSDNLDALEVVNNTFVANAGPFGSIGLARSIVFANNIFVDCPGAPPSGGFNNCYWRSGDVSGTSGTDGNIEADPLFVNLEAGDYHLQPDSPCRDAGINIVGANETDRNGGPRIVNGRVDIGAYELPLSPVQAARHVLNITAGITAATAADGALDRDGIAGVTLGDALLALRAEVAVR